MELLGRPGLSPVGLCWPPCCAQHYKDEQLLFAEGYVLGEYLDPAVLATIAVPVDATKMD